MLILFKIAMTISVVWLVAGLIGLMLKENGMRPNFGVGVAAFLTAALVGYIWDVPRLLY
jgi:hypothetical protein